MGFNAAVKTNEWTGGSAYPTLVEATVVEELPALLYRLELSNKSQVLAHGAGAAQRNWVRLLPGDRVEVEFAEHDLTRGRIVKKVV
ncbi:MAG: translation initiation factor IF-1 [Bryobacteraceae bacterium]|jgi:translation initiation factor IF-1